MPIYHETFRKHPYWWDTAPRPEIDEQPPSVRADVVIIGSGYTGLSAALVLARGGRDVLVLDAEAAGFGCSTRNGGQVSTSIKPSLAELTQRHGETAARAIIQEGRNALGYIRDMIAGEGIDCDWQPVGRFVGAHNSSAFEALARKAANQPKGLEVEAHVVPRSEQYKEIGTDLYHGGVVYPDHAAVDPAKLHAGLLRKAIDAGVRIAPFCPALSIDRGSHGFTVATPKGKIAARDVVVATNGYTGSATPALRRRVIPIGSYIIATEPLPPDIAAQLIPNARVVSDTRRVVFYYRLCAERRRMIFGGRVALWETDSSVTAPRLHAEMCKLFPQLSGAKVTHSWHGTVAFTFDTMPHLGNRDGIHYAMGYCGSGVSLSVYFGARTGQRLLGKAEGRTALDDLPFPTRPFYSGNPWFLAPSIAYYRMRDRLNV